MRKAKEIELRWTYPKEMNAAWESDDSYGRGIYQITRWFGDNESLIYIGLVKKKNRDFYIRLNEHWKWLENLRGEVYIRFGKIVKKEGLHTTEKLIETIEGALICEHDPKLNTCKINSYTAHKELVIRNTGYRGFLHKVVDTRDHDG